MIIPDFQNTESAFRSRSSSELKKMRLLFQLMGSYELTKIGTFLIKTALKWHFPIKKLIKNTLFKQFCGGESLEECSHTMEKLHSYGVSSIPDFSAEAGSQPDYLGAFHEIMRSIEFVARNPSCTFAVFKASALGPSHLFEKYQQNSLSESERNDLSQLTNRFKELCQKAEQLRVKLLVDAEESWIQAWIDDTTKALSIAYNSSSPVVFLTFQMYRKDSMNRLREYLQHAQAHHYHPAVKLVRGAYLEKERQRSDEQHYPSPIHDSKADTDECFTSGLHFCIENGIALCAGSHNQSSTELLTSLYSKRKAEVYFAQLYGMSDNLSFILAEHKFPVAKYVPYGPVELVMPYLFRRAEENTSVTGEVGRELALIKKELKRRNSA